MSYQNNDNALSRLLTPEEAAAILSVKLNWIRKAVFNKRIPYLKVGRLVRFKVEELQEWQRTISNAAQNEFDNKYSTLTRRTL